MYTENVFTNRQVLIRYIASPANNKIKAYILDNILFDSGLYCNSITKTGKEVGVSARTAIDTFKLLIECDFIRRYAKNAWAINPQLIYSKNSKCYKELMETYSSLPQEYKAS